jgi:hypothetical protein
MRMKAKGLWMMAALVLGMGMGFTAGAGPAAQEPSAESAVECLRDWECDARCGEVGSGACEFGRCYCRW